MCDKLTEEKMAVKQHFCEVPLIILQKKKKNQDPEMCELPWGL